MLLIGNCSSHRQIRWTTAIVPSHALSNLPPSGFIGNVFFQRGAKRTCGENLHLLADVAGNDVLKVDIPDTPPAHHHLAHSLSRLAPSPESLRLELRVGSDRAGFGTISIDQSGTHRTRIHLRSALRGFVAELWADIWSWTDIVDICGRITWSDRSHPGHWSPVMGDEVRIECGVGSWHIDYAKPWGMTTDTYEIQPLVGGAYPDGMSFPFYGAWVPSLGEIPPPDDPLGIFWERRQETALAAREGPVLALWSSWSGEWFASGGIPPASTRAATQATLWARFQAKLDRQGSITAQREWASPLQTGSTGDQAPFGAAKDYWLLQSPDPRRIYQLRESTVDYLLRCHHHAEASAKPFEFAHRTGVRSWSLGLFRTGDLMGKSTETPGGSHAYGRALVDDQHRGDTYIAAVRHVTDDPLLEADLFDRTQMDLARAKRHNRTQDAPRAAGRLFQSWAMALHTAWSQATKDAILACVVDEWDLWRETVNTPTGPINRAQLGPVKPTNVINTDTRVIDGGPAWIPWQSAVMFVGLHHIACALDAGPAETQLPQQIRAYMEEIAATNLLYGVVRDQQGILWPLNGVLWLPKGEPNNEAYYKFPRAGASFGDDAWDMLVGTRGWFNTMGWPSLVKIYAREGKDPKARAIAKEILAGITTNPDAKTCEWLAV